MRAATILFVILLSSNAFAQNGNLARGRSLPGGTWQPYNTKAAIHSSEPVYGDSSSNPFQPLTWWGEDVRLTYFGTQYSTYGPEIVASGNYINVAWWLIYAEVIYIVTSTDGGYTWINRQLTDEYTTNAVVPQIAASDSNVYVVYRAGRPNWGDYLNRSTDYGVTWLPTQRIYYTARNYSEKPVIASKDSMAYIVSAIEVDYVPPQDWDFWLFRSRDCGQTWPDTFFVSDSTYSGLGPDLAVNNYGLHLIRGFGLPSSNATEVTYNGSIDGGETWFGPIFVSDNDSVESFWPQIASWGDSNVAVSWTDYKNSQQAWSGDAFFSKSTDNGHTWSPPYQLTFSHMIQGTDIAASGDTIIICYDDARDGNSAIYAIISLDGGESWQDDLKVSDSPYYCIESSVAISGEVGHLNWADSRNNPTQSFEIYYDRGSISSRVEQDGHAGPEDTLLISSYPNPFNSSTIINISGMKGGEAKIAIYDLTGRLVKEFNENNMKESEIKEVWDASDNFGKPVSSGVYFARASNQNISKTIKVIYLR